MSTGREGEGGGCLGDWVQLIVLGATVPFFLFPRADRIWLLTLAPLFIVGRAWKRKRFFTRTPLDLGIAILSIQVFLTTVVTGHVESAFPKITGIVLGILTYYSLLNVLRSANQIRWGLAAFVLGGTLIVLIGVSGMAWSSELYYRPELWSRFPLIRWSLPGASEGFNANAIGGLLVLLIPSVLSPIRFRPAEIKRARAKRLLRLESGGLVAVLVVLILALLFTESFGAWLALFGAFWMLRMKGRQKFVGLASAILFIGGLFALSRPMGQLPLGPKLKHKIQVRVPLWNTGLEVVGRHPVFGLGLNQVRKMPAVGDDLSHVHNQFLHTAAELGLPGLAAYLLILAAAGKSCWRGYRDSPDPSTRRTIRDLAAGQAALVIFGLTDAIPLGAKIGLWFWVSLALITALVRDAENRAGSSARDSKN